jgi:dihydrofolate synthase/folylpolyglutamate synthase
VDRGLTDYKSALERLFARTGSTAKFGLDRTRALLALLGNPHERFRSFHVAGTNGKGSVVATIDALLRGKNLRVGRYTSPHLIDFRERIAVNGEVISEAKVEKFLARWETDCQRLGATFFEITTALAFHHFATCEVDVAVIETGLGGRLDSTNVITPLAAAITAIGIDHTEYLGNTIADIAREKAGIFKRGIPAVYGRMSDEASRVVIATAQSIGAHPIIAAQALFTPTDIHITRDGTAFDVVFDGTSAKIMTGLIGLPQAWNTCVALAMLEVAGDVFRVNLEDAHEILPGLTVPGRFQRIGNFILDVAHNPDSMIAFCETLDAVRPARPMVAVLGVLRDKNWRAMMQTLCPRMEVTILTAPASAPTARVWNPAEAEEFGKQNGWDVRRVDDLAQALDLASREAASVVVTGSFHTVGDALALMGKT